jgi:hypothetical protein
LLISLLLMACPAVPLVPGLFFRSFFNETPENIGFRARGPVKNRVISIVFGAIYAKFGQKTRGPDRILHPSKDPLTGSPANSWYGPDQAETSPVATAPGSDTYADRFLLFRSQF